MAAFAMVGPLTVTVTAGPVAVNEPPVRVSEPLRVELAARSPSTSRR